MSFPSRELALHCARLLDQKGGDEVRVLQMPTGGLTFDFAVLVTAKSDRLANALVEEVWHFCKRHGVPRMPVEGESGWMLIDCYDVVVHALNEDKRAYYQLDTLWPTSRELAWAKEVKQLADPDRPAPVAAPEPAKPARKRASKAEKAEAAPEVGADVAEAAPKPKRAARKKAAEPVEVVTLEARPDPKKRKAAPRVARTKARDEDMAPLPVKQLSKLHGSPTRTTRTPRGT